MDGSLTFVVKRSIFFTEQSVALIEQSIDTKMTLPSDFRMIPNF